MKNAFTGKFHSMATGCGILRIVTCRWFLVAIAAAALVLVTCPASRADSVAVDPPPQDTVSSSAVTNPAPDVADVQTNAGPGIDASAEALPATVPASVSGVTIGPVHPPLDPQGLLTLARQQRLDKNAPLAGRTLETLLDSNPSTEYKRLGLFEMALVAQDELQYVRAEQIYAQYLHLYPDDPSAPDIILRQGLVYRQMGVATMAISKFYAVMSTCLKLKLDNTDYYKRLVLQAQHEIADTYYMEGSYVEAADLYGRLAKMDSPDLNEIEIQYRLIRSLSYLTNHNDTVAKAQMFLEVHTNAPQVPEVRFVLASELKALGRNQDSALQVLLLLQSQEKTARQDPADWIYWQRRAGNEIANQFYKEGDYIHSLQIYLSLADLDKSVEWQLPIQYQTGLVYEQLLQWPRAKDTYQGMLDRRNELTESNSTPSLLALMDMARWRKDYLAWLEGAHAADDAFRHNALPPVTPAPSATGSP
jgi:tetratricopeptide (TPR) repeat protein